MDVDFKDRLLILPGSGGAEEYKLPSLADRAAYVAYMTNIMTPDAGFCKEDFTHQISSTTSFNAPAGCFYDPVTEYIYIADELNHRIVKVRIDGTGFDAIGSIGAGPEQFNNPSDVWYDAASGYLYIADASNNRIVKTKWDYSGWTVLVPAIAQFRVEALYYDPISDFLFFTYIDSGAWFLGQSQIDETGWTIFIIAPDAAWDMWYDIDSALFYYTADNGLPANGRIVRSQIDGGAYDTLVLAPIFGGVPTYAWGLVINPDDDHLFISYRRWIPAAKAGIAEITWTGVLVDSHESVVGCGPEQFTWSRRLDGDFDTGFLYVPGDTCNKIVKTKVDGLNWEELS